MVRYFSLDEFNFRVDGAAELSGLEYGGWSSEEDAGDEMDVDQEMGEAGEVHVADTEWWAAKLRTGKSPTKEDVPLTTRRTTIVLSSTPIPTTSSTTISYNNQ